MTQNILIALFCVVMIGNVVALVRHWYIMRALAFVLRNFVESQKQFNEIMEAERRKRT